jgi:hypothetical protein
MIGAAAMQLANIRRDQSRLIARSDGRRAASPFQRYRVLKIDAERWQQPLHNCGKAD